MTGLEKLPDTNVILRYLLEDNKLLYEKAKNNHMPLVTFDENLKKCVGKITPR